MNMSASSIFKSAVLACLIGGTALTSSAQQAQFHLPFEAKWGGRVLPPGDYTVHLPDRSLGSPNLLVQGPVRVGFITPMTSYTNVAGEAPLFKDRLKLSNINGEYFVKTYECSLKGITYFFKVPAPTHRVEMASVQKFVEVTVSGK